MSDSPSTERLYATSSHSMSSLRIGSKQTWNKHRVNRPFPPNAFVEARDGEVLGKGMILKHDHFETGLIDRCEVHFCGAPNFRLILHGNLGAVGQATVPGMRAIFNFLNTRSNLVEQQFNSPGNICRQLFPGASPTDIRSPSMNTAVKNKAPSTDCTPSKSYVPRTPSGKNLPSLSVRHRQPKGRETRIQSSLLWINLREEPVVFVNGRPFVLRDASQPLTNICSHRGMHWKRVLKLERRLKQDILAEAMANNGNILVHTEVSGSALETKTIPCWESVMGKNSVMTTLEAFELLKQEGYAIEYRRIPVTAQSYLTMSHISSIQKYLQMIFADSRDNFVMFNCQMGTGRSTFGTLISMILGVGVGAFSKEEIYEKSEHMRNVRKHHLGSERFGFQVVRRLLRLLDNGREAKKLADAVIDCCGRLVNIRDRLLETRIEMEQASTPDRRSFWLRTTVGLLRRYFLCICISAYVIDVGDWVKKKVNFNKWMAEHDELGKVMETWISQSTSEVHGQLRLNFSSILRSFVPLSHNPMDIHISKRQGTLLGMNMILVEDLPTGDLNSRYEYGSFLEGAHNFYFEKKVGQGCCSVAQPTIQGITTILHLLRTKAKEGSSKILWVNLREEPVIYINDIPVVLREKDAPFSRLPEFDLGLTQEKIKSIATRLKEDCLQEAEDFERLLVHKITPSGNSPQAMWINRDQLRIRTMQEVFSEISADYTDKLEYLNVPCSPEKTIQESNFDRFTELIDEALLGESVMVFNSGLGKSRSTAAMILITLAMVTHQDLKLEMQTKIDVEEQPDTQFRGINQLIRIIRDGRRIQQMVDSAIRFCGKNYNPILAIHEERDRWEQARHPEDAETYLETCMSRFLLYANLICYADFLYERAHALQNDLPSKVKKFSEWFSSKPEIKIWRKNCQANPDDALALSYFGEGDAHRKIFEHRTKCNNVLVTQTILKMDLWPTLLQSARCIKSSGPFAVNWQHHSQANVVGLGMPTTEVMHNVLSHIYQQECNGGEGAFSVKWFNLRGEPIIYVHGLPTVLRDLHDPYENVDFSGMNEKRLEQNENQLKEDAQKEICEMGTLLLHDEDATLNLCAEEHEVQIQDIETCEEAYSRVFEEVMKQYECQLEYRRIPMTDEEAPNSMTMDYFLSEFEKTLGKNYMVVFNCQMGRGRTTSGIVIYILWCLSKGLTHIDSLKVGSKCKEIPDGVREEFWNGDFKAVHNLRRLQADASRGKELLDRVIDHVEEIQNLRQCITKVYLRAEQQLKEKKKVHYFQVARQYLKRYLSLIVFSTYLLKDNQSQSYTSWLDDRQDVVTLLNSFKLDQITVTPGVSSSPSTRSPSVLNSTTRWLSGGRK